MPTLPSLAPKTSPTGGPGYINPNALVSPDQRTQNRGAWEQQMVTKILNNLNSGNPETNGKPGMWDDAKYGSWSEMQRVAAQTGLMAGDVTRLFDFVQNGGLDQDAVHLGWGAPPPRTSADFVESPEQAALRLAQEKWDLEYGLQADSGGRDQARLELQQREQEFAETKFAIQLALDNASRQGGGGGGGGYGGGGAYLSTAQPGLSDTAKMRLAAELEMKALNKQLDFTGLQNEANRAIQREQMRQQAEQFDKSLAQNASQFEWQKQQEAEKLKLERAGTLAELNANPADWVQRDYALRGWGSPEGQRVDAFSGNQVQPGNLASLPTVMEENAAAIPQVAPASGGLNSAGLGQGADSFAVNPSALTSNSLPPMPPDADAPGFARGYGVARDRMAILGDNTKRGQKTGNEELLINWTGAPFTVIPNNDLPDMKKLPTGDWDIEGMADGTTSPTLPRGSGSIWSPTTANNFSRPPSQPRAPKPENLDPNPGVLPMKQGRDFSTHEEESYGERLRKINSAKPDPKQGMIDYAAKMGMNMSGTPMGTGDKPGYAGYRDPATNKWVSGTPDQINKANQNRADLQAQQAYTDRVGTFQQVGKDAQGNVQHGYKDAQGNIVSYAGLTDAQISRGMTQDNDPNGRGFVLPSGLPADGTPPVNTVPSDEVPHEEAYGNADAAATGHIDAATGLWVPNPDGKTNAEQPGYVAPAAPAVPTEQQGVAVDRKPGQQFGKVTTGGTVKSADGGGTLTLAPGDYEGPPDSSGNPTYFYWDAATSKWMPKLWKPTIINTPAEFNALPPDVQRKIMAGEITGYMINDMGYDATASGGRNQPGGWFQWMLNRGNAQQPLSRTQFEALPDEQKKRLLTGQEGQIARRTTQGSVNATPQTGMGSGMVSGLMKLPTMNTNQTPFYASEFGVDQEQVNDLWNLPSAQDVEDQAHNDAYGAWQERQSATTPTPPATPPVPGTPPATGTPPPPTGTGGTGGTGAPAPGSGTGAGTGSTTPATGTPAPAPNNGDPSFSGIVYGPDVLQSLPSLQYLQGALKEADWSQISGQRTYVPGLKIWLPAPGELNYGILNNLKTTSPASWQGLVGAFKAGNRDLDSEMATLGARAPMGSAYESTLVAT